AGHLDGFELGLHLGHFLLHRLGLFHQLAEIFHDPSSPVLASSPGSLAISSPGPASSAVASAAASAAAKRSPTAANVAPGKASTAARTHGCAATSSRRA